MPNINLKRRSGNRIAARPRRTTSGSSGSDEFEKEPILIEKVSLDFTKHFDDSCWSPSCYSVFKLLMSVRIAAALWSNISDCDETFNFWEPLHLMLYDSGLQTWEYSPAFALRSYAYIWLHALPAKAYRFAFSSAMKLTVFYSVRCFLALFTALAEVLLYRALNRCVSRNLARHWFVLAFFCPGLFISSAAFLPSSFSMICNMIALACWLEKQYFLAVFATAVSAMLGWPFAAVLGLPIVLDLLLIKREYMQFFSNSAISGVAIGVFMLKVDSYFYGVSVFAPLNIVVYNVLGSGGGSHLYGTEPLSYYLVNCFLNLNLIFFAALAAILTILMGYRRKMKFYESDAPRIRDSYFPVLFIHLSLYAWLLIFFSQAHKEERFLFPVYPLFTLCGAVFFDGLEKHLATVKLPKSSQKLPEILYALCVITIAGLSLSRVLALYKNYHAPFETYMQLANESLVSGSRKHVNVCVGKEWYRYPSSFFLPNDKWRLRFIKSEFEGILPQPYEEKLSVPESTRAIPEHMNDQNLEEPTRYFPVEKCDFLVDLSYGGQRATKLEPDFVNLTDRWEVIFSRKFLDSARSHRFFRAFYIPVLSEHFCSYADYVLLRARKPV